MKKIKVKNQAYNQMEMVKMTLEKKLLEKLASLEHEQWSHLINYQHSLQKGMVNYVYAQKWKDWLKQASTPYNELTEKEKNSDREWARKVLAIVDEELGEVAQKIRNRKQQLIKQLKNQPYPRTNTDSLIIEAGLSLLDWFSDLLVENSKVRSAPQGEGEK